MIELREKTIYSCAATSGSFTGEIYITVHKNIIGKLYSKEKDAYSGFEFSIREVSSISKENEKEIVIQCKDKFYRFQVEKPDILFDYLKGLIASLDWKARPL